VFDLTGPFFEPLWRRIVLVGFLLVWTAMEFLSGSPFWGVLVLGLAGWSAYELFLKKHPVRPDDDER